MLDRGIGHFLMMLYFDLELVVTIVSVWLLVWLTHLQMSGAGGKVPVPDQAIYSASKHALNGYFGSLRFDV
jgi:NAD(P)-dependent dehydrogenase (short-subunit alcohol dehydrogenase family)